MRLAEEELARMIHDAALAVVLITDREPSGPPIPFEVLLALMESFGSGRAPDPGWTQQHVTPSASDGCLMIYTPAVGGRPTGALFTHQNIVACSIQDIVLCT
jgi:long-subunit acyl-CoA synthetase (AMP-forming)